MTLKKGTISEIDAFWMKSGDPKELSFPNKPLEIYDPIFGYIELTTDERFIVDLPPLQRLRYISQLGLGQIVFPGATQTRFAHTLGVYHIAKKFLESLSGQIEGSTIEEYKTNVLYAALLHDICQFPFSHSLEPIFKENFYLNHEDLSAKFVNGSYFKAVFDIINEKEKITIDAELIANCIKGKYDKSSCLTQLINGFIDSDKIDYLVRDSHFTGVPFGRIDAERIAKTVVPLRNKNDVEVLAFEEKGLPAIESLIAGRSLMYKSVYLHHTSITASAMLIRATHSCLERKNETAISLLKINDGNLLTELQNGKGFEKEIISRLVKRELLARLFSFKASEVNYEEFNAFFELPLHDRIKYEQQIAEELQLERGFLVISLNEFPKKLDLTIPILQEKDWKFLYKISGVGEMVDPKLYWRSYIFYESYDEKIEKKVKNQIKDKLGLNHKPLS